MRRRDHGFKSRFDSEAERREAFGDSFSLSLSLSEKEAVSAVIIIIIMIEMTMICSTRVISKKN
jgi:hypothetical protein